MKKKNYLLTLLTFLIFTSGLVNAQQTVLEFEDFESGSISNEWIILDENNDSYMWEVASTESYAHSGTHFAEVDGYMTETLNDDYLILPKLLPTTLYDEVTFWAKSTPYGDESIQVVLSTTGTEADDFTILLEDIPVLPQSYTEYTYDLTAYIGQEVFFAIRYVSIADLNMPCIDDISYPKMVSDIDLAAGVMFNDIDLLVDYPNQMIIEVSNIGVDAVTDYSIEVYEQGAGGDVLLGTFPQTEPIAAGQTINVEFEMSFSTTGTYNLYGVVVVENDGAPENNTTDTDAFEVGDEAIVVLGTPPNFNSGDIPSSFFHSNSLTQTLFLAEDLNMYPGLTLTEIMYFLKNGMNNSGSQNLTIYIGETTRTTLNDGLGMIPANELTEIFQGSLYIPTGNHDIPIEIDPYVYTGQNLVVMTQKVNNGVIPYAGWTVHTSNNEGASLMYFDNDSPADPNNPPAISELEISADIPKIQFTFENEATYNGILTGEVSDGTAPIQGAQVTISALGLNTTTDVNGIYTFSSVLIGSYDVEASATGYQSSIVNGVEIVTDQTTNQDFVLSEIPDPTINLSGIVYNSQDNMTLSGVIVTMSSDGNDYSTTTNESGFYSFTDVVANNTYNVFYEKDGFQSYTTSIEVLDENVSMDPVYLDPLTGGLYGVVNSTDGVLENVQVSITGSGLATTTNEDGYYEFEDLEAGSYEVTFVCYGYFTETIQDVIVESAQDTELNVQLMSWEDFPVLLNGYVFGEQDGNPLENVLVEFESELFNYSTYSDENGYYEIQNAAGFQEYTITYTKSNYGNEFDEVVVEDQNVELEDVFMSLLQYQVSVYVSTNEVGEDNVSGAIVNLIGVNENENNYSDVVTSSGLVIFPSVYHGVYNLELHLEGFEDYVLSNVIIADDSVFDVELIEIIEAPFALDAEDVGFGETTLSWDHSLVGSESFVEFEVFLNGTSVNTTSGTDYVFNNLSYDQSYSMGVRAIYSSGFSEIVSLNHTYLWESTNNTLSESIKVYPNPSQGDFTVEAPIGAIAGLYTVSGKLMNNFIISNSSQTIYSGLATGVYVLKITTKNKTIVKKIIID